MSVHGGGALVIIALVQHDSHLFPSTKSENLYTARLLEVDGAVQTYGLETSIITILYYRHVEKTLECGLVSLRGAEAETETRHGAILISILVPRSHR